ncbi:hypothetical protein RHSP_20823 [Rhizobium freirei PRF 81]|uniref:Uncharacterized protein n=1 Tax=Rhizobium freirei PRF 81 TaxID=363754 RepID=N6U1Q0_9HYPH|nr:hypothetical protein RHSP_20823 [Rhizobium freirei PRF 81]
MFYQIEFPTTTGFLELPLVIPAFMQHETQIFVAHQPGCRIVQQQVKLCERTRRNPIAMLDNGRRILDSNGVNSTVGLAFSQANPQECRLLLIALYQIDVARASLRQQYGGYHARKTAAAAEIDPMIGLRVELENLSAIGDMSLPKIVDRGRCY